MCHHPTLGPFGYWARSARKKDGACGPAGTLWKPLPPGSSPPESKAAEEVAIAIYRANKCRADQITSRLEGFAHMIAESLFSGVKDRNKREHLEHLLLRFADEIKQSVTVSLTNDD